MTIDSWWLLWLAFMFVFLISWLVYGRRNRKGGLPFSRYMQRRRKPQTVGGGEPPDA